MAILGAARAQATPWTRIERQLEADQFEAARALADSFAAAATDPVARAARIDSLGVAFAAKPSEAALEHATSLLEESLALRERALGRDHLDVATSLEHLATLYFDRAEYDQALPLDERSLAIRRKQLGDAHPTVAKTQLGLGTSYTATGRYTAARPLFEAALATLERSPGDHRQERMELLTSLGELRRIENRYAEAETCLVRAVRLARAIVPPGDPFTAYPLNNLAGVYKDQGRFDVAEPLLRESLALRRAAPEPDPESLANAYLNLAELYRLQGRADADTLYARALELARSAMQPDNPQLVWFLNQYAVQHREHLQWRQAEARTREALAILEKSPEAELLLAQTLCDLGELLRAQGRPAEAEVHDRRAIAIREKALGKDHPEVALARIGLGRSLLARADRSKNVRNELDRAIRVLDDASAFPEGRADAYAARAQWHAARGNRRAARADLAVAIATVEELRPRRGGEDVRTSFLGSHADLYDDMVRWCVADADLERAFEYAERGRARIFLEQLAASHVPLDADVPAAVRAPLEARAANARLQLNEIQDRIAALTARSDVTAAERVRRIADLERERDRSALELRRAQDELRRASPRWGEALSVTRRPASLDSIARLAIPPHGVLLEYQIGAKESFVLAVSNTTPPIAAWPLVVDADAASQLGIAAGPLSALELNRAISLQRMLRLGVSTRGIGDVRRVQGGSEDLNVRLQALARVLMPAELWKRVAACSEVAIVPDGALHGLPFESLIVQKNADGTTHDWLELGPVVRYAPSAGALARLQGRQRSTQPSRASEILIVADPALVTQARRSAALAKLRLTSLPGTAQEGDAVRAAFKPGAVTQLRGTAATEARVRAALPHKRYVHLATHGLVDRERNALLAGLAFAPGTGKPRLEDDGFLQLFEIYDLQLDCDLAVLSACETGAGVYVEGEGVATLSRAFLAAGAARVVASLWAVEDASTAALIGDFFTRITADERAGKEPNIARALRDAKRKIRSQPAWSEPFYWAPFILTGVH